MSMPSVIITQKHVRKITPGRYKNWMFLRPGETVSLSFPYHKLEVRYDNYGLRAVKVVR